MNPIQVKCTFTAIKALVKGTANSYFYPLCIPSFHTLTRSYLLITQINSSILLPGKRDDVKDRKLYASVFDRSASSFFFLPLFFLIPLFLIYNTWRTLFSFLQLAAYLSADEHAMELRVPRCVANEART